MKPLIAVTPLFESNPKRQYMNFDYFAAILDNGGIPVMLPIEASESTWDEYLDRVDGILFTGGQDVNPVLYKQTPMETTLYVCPERDALEYGLCKKAIEKNKVILGICRGEQLLNVAFGGSLYQHIDGHRQEEKGAQNLRITKVLEGSFLHSLVGESEIKVNSFHHQAVKSVAPGFIASARAEDGTVEAIEPERKTDRFFLAVQWHPEFFYSTDSAAEKIFKAFIEAAKKYNK